MDAGVYVEIGDDALFFTTRRATRTGRALASSKVDINRRARLDAIVAALVSDPARVATPDGDLDAAERGKPVWSCRPFWPSPSPPDRWPGCSTARDE